MSHSTVLKAYISPTLYDLFNRVPALRQTFIQNLLSPTKKALQAKEPDIMVMVIEAHFARPTIYLEGSTTCLEANMSDWRLYLERRIEEMKNSEMGKQYLRDYSYTVGCDYSSGSRGELHIALRQRDRVS